LEVQSEGDCIQGRLLCGLGDGHGEPPPIRLAAIA
jgi:hypothetical protein